MVGAETIRIDNPKLTVREVRGARQPIRVVMTSSGKLPQNAQVFTDRHAKNTLIYKNEPLAAVLADLGKKDVTSVTIEGGGNMLGHALDQRLIDKVQIYLAPIFTGGPVLAFAGEGARSTAQSARLERTRFEEIGPDLCVIGYPKYSLAAT
jgi:diaminohydroxyphosphoribosylaminopyrimidine deaminase/5-amino-6-(5-phosphoribosylamino)uracil reductase